MLRNCRYLVKTTLPNFLQTCIFGNFEHISRIWNRINYRNIWFPKVIINLIMPAQVLFFQCFFLKKTHTLMPLRKVLFSSRSPCPALYFSTDFLPGPKIVPALFFPFSLAVVSLFFVKSLFVLLVRWIILNWILSFDSLSFICLLTNSL